MPSNSFVNLKYANCQKKKSSSLLLSKHSNIENDIVIITEPFMGKNRKATFQSPWNVHSGSNDARAIIITPPWADAYELPEHSDRDSFFCIINSKGHKFILGVFYCDEGHINDNTWIPRLNALKLICPEVIIFADSNAHSTLWGYSRSDAKGKRWEEVLALANFEVFTDSYFTTFRNSRNHSSCIDICFGTPSSKHLLSDRIAESFSINSDHLPWNIQFNDQPNEDESVHLKLKEADWVQVNNNLKCKIQNLTIAEIPDRDHIDYVVNKFNCFVKQTIDETIKKSYRRPKNRWWTPELSRMQAAIESEINVDTKIDLIKEFDKKILKAKGDEWKCFANHCTSVSEAYLKNKILKLEHQNRSLHPIEKPDGTMSESGKESADILLGSWFKFDRLLFMNDRLEKIEQDINSVFPIADVDDFPPVSEAEVMVAIHSMKSLSAPGEDDIPAIFLQQTCTIVVPFLTDVFNKCILLGFTPSCWKSGRVVLIPKGNRLTGTNKDYRPITLLSVTAKIFEKIILKRLQQQDCIKKWISPKQFGFQPGKSTSHALVNYATKISSCLKLNESAIGIHLDIEGAFNSVWRPILLKRLKDLDCPKYLLNWCNDYLLNRKLVYKSTSFSTCIDVERSTPQGGSLSPFFWSIIIDPLIDIIGNRAEVTVFADDIAFVVTGPTWDKAAQKANRILKDVSDWAKNNALRFSPEKSEYILYSWQRNIVFSCDIFLNGAKLNRVNKVKYLGVIFSEKLQWKAHLTYVADKAIRILFKLSSIVNRIWGLSGKYLKILYLGAIEPILLHGCPVWASAIPRKTLMKSLTRVQRIACRYITRNNRKTHLLDNLMLSGIPPIEYRAKELSLRWWAGAISDPDNPCKDAIDQLELHNRKGSHFSSIQQLEAWFTQLGINRKEVEVEHSKMKTKLKCPTPEAIFCEPNVSDKHLINDMNFIYFTDGSKSDDGVGAAYTKWNKDGIVSSWGTSLDNNCSIYKAELLAINYALDEIIEMNETKVAIITDSLSAFNVLKKPTTNGLIESIRLKLIRINRTKLIRLAWTRAHVGNVGNESADSLAKAMAKCRPSAPMLPRDKMELVTVARQQKMREWQLSWESRREKWSFRWNNKVSRRMRLENFSNEEAELLNNFFAGSIGLNDRLNLWGLKPSPNCDSDPGFRETPRHFLFLCSSTNDLRESLISIISAENGTRQLTFKSIWNSDECLHLLARKLKERFQ